MITVLCWNGRLDIVVVWLIGKGYYGLSADCTAYLRFGIGTERLILFVQMCVHMYVFKYNEVGLVLRLCGILQCTRIVLMVL